MKDKRVTIMVDSEIDRKLRLLQAKNIRDSNSSYSYSRTIDDILRKHFKVK